MQTSNFQKERKQRKKLTRDGWILVGLVMLILPLGGKVALALLYTFLAFAYLDEKPYGEVDSEEIA